MEQSRQGPAYGLWAAMERYRRDNGLTLEQFAARAGLGRQTLDRLKDSRTPPRATTVHKMAAALGITQAKAEELASLAPLDGNQPSTAEAHPAERAGPEVGLDTREAIKRDPRLTAEGRKVVLAAYDAIAGAFNPPTANEAPDSHRRAG